MSNTFRNVARSMVVALLLAGLTTGGEGIWIYAKAKLAQLLLAISWRSAPAVGRYARHRPADD